MDKEIIIAYEIFESHIDEMRNMSLKEFDKEFTDIYGNLKIAFGENEFISSMLEDVPIEVKECMSELITSYLDALICLVDKIENSDVLYLKYIENSFSWLKVKKKNNNLLFYEVNKQYIDEMNNRIRNFVLVGDDLFTDECILWGPVRIDQALFNKKILSVVTSFVKEIKEINPILIKSNLFRKQLNFINRNGVVL
ncbi:hypothetical protein SH1V18_38490 [Vallitalea longa]|uniref:Uncharacterized protein n=1 Tax=Vallitalea longa TaxID=2936439 RepID=A0A9W6DHZ5_9FIRM|nr:hypothetical protein [Vallitalea longa]GKX31369.1 hypothetical protein SH1V18_38490 [Vallitalea longa]